MKHGIDGKQRGHTKGKNPLDDILTGFTEGTKPFEIADVLKLLKKEKTLQGQMRVAKGLMSAGLSFWVFQERPEFSCIDDPTFAKLFLETGGQEALILGKLSQLENLTPYIADLLIEKGYWKTVLQNLRSFHKDSRPRIQVALDRERKREENIPYQ